MGFAVDSSCGKDGFSVGLVSIEVGFRPFFGLPHVSIKMGGISGFSWWRFLTTSAVVNPADFRRS